MMADRASEDQPRCVHYVGFRDDRYWNAYRIWGGPRMIHRRWDRIAQHDVGPEDVIIFAEGDEHQPLADYNATDIDERWLQRPIEEEREGTASTLYTPHNGDGCGFEMAKGSRPLDRFYRGFYWLAFRILWVWWFFRRPLQRGALVLIHHSGHILLVRTSYQDYWSAPGGGIGSDEQPIEAAVRELREETGIDLPSNLLSLALEVKHFIHYRHDHVWLFEWYPEERPIISIDLREIVEARWFTCQEAAQVPLLPHLKSYFQKLRL